MIIQDPLAMSPVIRSLIEANPMAQLLAKEKVAFSNERQNYEGILQDTLDLKRRLQNSVIEQNVRKQTVRKAELKVKHLEKAVENSTNDFKCDFLNREAMTQFFESIGLKFIALNISQAGGEARLSYVRPARLVSALPIQPMIVTMCYELENSAMVFRKPEITAVLRSDINMHPHITTSGSVCMGNYFDVFEEENYSVQLEGYQDQVILLENLLSTFNPDSPYARIDQIIMGLVKGVYYRDCDYCVERSNSYTFLNTKLDTEGQGYFAAHDLITEEYYRDFYALLGNMAIEDTAQDIIDSLPNEYRSNDSENENFDHFQSYQNSLNKMFGISLPDPDCYAGYDEDDDFYSLSEDQFEDMIGDWKEKLEPLLESEAHFAFNDLPNLDEMFPKPVEINLTDLNASLPF